MNFFYLCIYKTYIPTFLGLIPPSLSQLGELEILLLDGNMLAGKKLLNEVTTYFRFTFFIFSRNCTRWLCKLSKYFIPKSTVQQANRYHYIFLFKLHQHQRHLFAGDAPQIPRCRHIMFKPQIVVDDRAEESKSQS